jgi:protease-4
MLLLILPALAFSQTDLDWRSLDLAAMDYPTASIDNLFIPLANPSLLGTGHASGLGWAHTMDDWKFRKHYWLFANLDGISYNYEYAKDAATGNSVNYHTLATGMELLPKSILPNLYAGTHYRWENNGFGKGDWRTAVTYRPHSSASVALTLDNPYKESPAYHAGLAIRPLAFVPSIKDHRLELSADIDYDKDGGGYGFNDPVIGLHTRVLDGLNIGGTYNLDTKTAWLNFSLSIKDTDLGSVAQVSGGDYLAVPYIHFTDKVFHPFLGITGKNWYGMKLDGAVQTYKAPKYEFGPMKVFDSKTKSIEDLTQQVAKANDDPSVQGILLKNPSFSTSFGLMQELVESLRGFKSSGKKIAFYYDNISNGGYIFASSVADAIYLNPLGSVDLRGISTTSPYFKELLDSLGVDVLNFRSHKYKTAGNMLSESEMTEGEREAYDSMLQSIYDQIVASVETGRGDKLKASVRETIDNGPYYLANDALEAGLIDKVIFEDELGKELRGEFGFAKTISNIPDYIDYSWVQPKENLIAVIYAQGNIVMGKGTPGTKIAHKSTVDLIRAARQNPMYKGIILRVDSGGGSAQASDIILHELKLAQSVNKKPVVVSMSGVAASGGYYISCGADRIIADPATLTGSIGVIGLSLTMPRLYDKIGINWSTVKKGANADFGATHRAWSDAEKQRMTGFIEAIYEDFVGKVDAGREKLSLEQVHAIAQGRVWTGEQALANGLVDDLGGLDKAVEHMRELTGIEGELTLVDATTQDKGFEVQMDSDSFGGLMQSQIAESLLGDYIQVYELWRDFGNESALMLSPLEAQETNF